jgi:RNA polymerase sigma-54 factor
VRKVRGAWRVFLNPVLAPRLRVNPVYERLLGDGPDSRALQAQAQQAHSLIKGVNQRFSTVLRVTQVIVGRQEAFFERGMGAMRPLLLRDVALELDMHESTVSRATRQKYAQTPWGVIELKRFFGGALATDDGGTTSGEAVRSLIIKLVSEESGRKPLSDSQIAARLSEQGVVVARRTVAKYREAAGIESASVRKARAALSSI